MSSYFIVLPSLLCCYLGQAAGLIVDPKRVSNTFYETIPTPLFYPMIILATLAAVIGSQSIISASYSIASQAIRLNYFPRLTVVHTNEKESGQVYCPELNYLQMILVIIIIVAFQNATFLGYAYGVNVSFACFITTILYTFAIYFNFNYHWSFALLFFCFFGVIDFAFSNLQRTFHMGYSFASVLLT